MSLDQGRGSVIYVHLTLVPTITAAGEQKTKPTQHSVKELQKLGIQPTILICRTTKPLPRELKAKISLFCNVSEQDVISSTDVKTSIYEAPLMYREEKFDIQVLRHFNFSDSEIPEVKDNSWEKMVSVILAPRKIITIGLAGKYVSLQDAYRSIFEALMHGGIAHQVQIEIKRMDTEKVTRENVSQVFGGIDGILVPGGFGERGIEGKLISIGHARINKIPYLGICLGLQTAVIEFSRNVLHLENAHTTEINPDTPHPVISLLEEQASVDIFGGTMRLGEYPCELKENTLAYLAYGEKRIMERHRHRYEVNNNYVERLEKAGMCVSGRYPENQLVEIIELANHPWFVATQFHPEFISKPTKPHPLFRDFIGAAVNYNDSRQKEFFPSIAANKNKINAMNEADQ
jgi:CTP synthase